MNDVTLSDRDPAKEDALTPGMAATASENLRAVAFAGGIIPKS